MSTQPSGDEVGTFMLAPQIAPVLHPVDALKHYMHMMGFEMDPKAEAAWRAICDEKVTAEEANACAKTGGDAGEPRPS